jgi:hypothetical protein
MIFHWLELNRGISRNKTSNYSWIESILDLWIELSHEVEKHLPMSNQLSLRSMRWWFGIFKGVFWYNSGTFRRLRKLFERFLRMYISEWEKIFKGRYAPIKVDDFVRQWKRSPDRKRSTSRKQRTLRLWITQLFPKTLI